MLEEAVRKYALHNAIRYGEASVGPVIGKVMSEFPDERKRAGEVKNLVAQIVEEVNSMEQNERVRLLEDIAPELLEKKKKEERENVLVDLPDVGDKVVMRFAPGPSGPLHLGHTRAALLNDEYVKRHRGEYVLRLEDTNPEKIDPEAYSMIPEDMGWLEIKIHKIFRQSERFEIYYSEAKTLIQEGHAYVCSCPVEDWRQGKLAKKACVHRDLMPEVQLEEWAKMLDSTYSEGEAILAIKTRIDDPNPALRDFAAFRIVSSPHPQTGSRYCVYPLYNFSVAVDDHLMGVTHVLRGKDHLNNTLRQKYIYKYRGWKEPCFLHYGWVSIEDSILKTSTIREGIIDGEYTGWDDVRLGTIRAVARRGIQPGALRRYWLDVGIKQVDIEFSWENLYAMNRSIIEPESSRFFFVSQPVEYDVVSSSILESRAPKHPSNPGMGTRENTVSPGDTILLSEKDSLSIKEGGMVRLKDLGNFVLRHGKLEYEGNDIGVLKNGVGIVHWVSSSSSVPCEVILPSGETDTGFAEKAVVGMQGIVQFERYGFVNMLSWGDIGRGAFTHR